LFDDFYANIDRQSKSGGEAWSCQTCAGRSWSRFANH